MFRIRTLIFLFAVLCAGKANSQSVALTFDDGPVLGDRVKMTAAERNQALLAELSGQKVRAALFARCGGTPERLELVRKWGESGHLVGNHSTSHKSLHVTSLAEYSTDLLECDRVLKLLPGYTKLFRFPFLKEGESESKRDNFRAFLREINYRAAPVTIDTSDWYYNQRLRERIRADPTAPVEPYRNAYIAHLLERAEYYESLGRAVVGRSIPHVLLLHHNLINALFLRDVLQAFKARGWRIVDANWAFEDPLYSMAPSVIPAGESIVWALAKEKGVKGLRYPAEDSVYEESKLVRLGL